MPEEALPDVPVGEETEDEISSTSVSERSLAPDEYIYKTNVNVEEFKNVPYKPLVRNKWDLSPPSAVHPSIV